ncbi:CdaR family protein [Bariatricus sp. SGI.154]|uniref:CdaR family protein n=1 Tax=Bariatricus sp. SGI.154 TaxID=3420549 RepID=UPI003D06A7A5
MEKRLTANLGLKVLAFFTAVFMWFIVVNIDDPVIEKTYTGIPVQVVNEEVVTTTNRTYQIVDDTKEVNVTVRAQRSEMNKIKAENITATADMKELSLGTQIPIEVSVEGGRYESAYTTPRNLQVQIDDEAKNNFPITPTTIGTVREGYVVGELNVNPEKVTLRGPKTVINNISRVVAEADVSGLSENADIEARLILYDANNNVIDQTLLANNLGKEGVSVEVTLYQVKSVPIKLDTSMVTAAKGYKISMFSVEPRDVSVTGDKSDLSKLRQIDVPAEALNVSNLTQRTEKVIDISSYLPDGVSLVDQNASSVVVTIYVEQPGAKHYEVSTSSITVNNLAANLELSYGSMVDLELQIKGPEETLNVFSIAKKVSIDLKNYTSPGTYTVPVSVELPDGCSLVEDVSVEVILEEKVEEQEE